MSTEPSQKPTTPEEGLLPGPRSGEQQPIVVDGISYIPSSVLLTGIPKISLKDNLSFAVLDTLGEAPRIYSSNSELGFYFSDTRHLGTWETTFNGSRPVALTWDLKASGNTAVFSMTNRDLPVLGGTGRIPRDTFLFRRVLSLFEDTLFETLEVKNFDVLPHALQIELWAGGRFDDVFEVRGFKRSKRGRMLAPVESGREWEGKELPVTSLQYEGLDGKIRKTFVHRLFPAEKIRVSPSLVGYFTRIVVPPKETVSLKTVTSFNEPSDCRFMGKDYYYLNIPKKMDLLGEREFQSPFAGLVIESDNAIFNRSIQSAHTDIFMLLTEETSSLLYPYAGVPWFSAPFGRDGIITAYQLLPWYPALAKGVLEYVLQNLGTRDDPFTDEQPGKVFHELRRGEMTLAREVPFVPYYGTVDATPLSLILLYEYIRWTRDIESLRRWWPHALRALAWIERWGDSDSDGFLEYAQRSPTGLINQGWKDSHDSIMHADGMLAQAPIRLCEVQGYAFRARMGMSTLARLQGKTELASRLRLEALQLRAKFILEYWDAERSYVYLALDGKRNPCRVLSSNMGHCLWSQILLPEQASAVARHLVSESMFSGHGIRTLADTEIAYNPMSYHNGSVWPHDNSLILEGFRNYGLSTEIETLATALLEVIESSEDFRLPELYCGFRKRGDAPPVPYEVACKPQAWAAGAIFLMLRSMLGISMDVDQDYLVFNSPILTNKINTLQIRGLKGRDWEIDLGFRRTRSGTSVDVLRKHGNVRVLTVR